MNNKCGCNKAIKNDNPIRPPGVTPVITPSDSNREPIVPPPKKVVGRLIINKRIRGFGSNEELNGISLALYILIAFFLVIAIILIFFNLNSYFEKAR